MAIPERPKGIQPRAWEIATKHLQNTEPLKELKVDPPKAIITKEEPKCEECGDSPKDCECEDCECD